MTKQQLQSPKPITGANGSAPHYQVAAGRAHPLGATPEAGGVNFAVFSENATVVTLLLFDEHDAVEPFQAIEFDPRINKTFHVWHCYVRGLKPGVHYAYRVDGPSSPQDLHERGFRFNPNKVLIDPYARGTSTTLWRRSDACGMDDNLATSMRSIVIDASGYDWEGDRPLNRPIGDVVVYEMHVGGFTKSPTSGVEHPGTFAGVIEKIPYLKELGITTVELLPIHEFDSQELDRALPDGTRLTNYWGYSTVGFFAPESDYCTRPELGNHLDEFRDMVKALHRAGIGVVLDVVFNHTSEGNGQGPTISFRGFENSIYYHLVPNDRQYYMDYSGCGNTVNCNHPMVDKFILDCLEFWVREMHVDGFRFDEGSILARDQNGAPLAYPPVIWHIELSEVLADTKIIAEAWDAAGLYQIGYFPGYRWAEWNGRYRDDVRRFVKGEPGIIGALADRIAGSADLYQAHGHLPLNSVNFITAHDGFTLNDLVSYDQKHNEANGEGNRDGSDDNLSWNCGVEGATDDPAVDALRRRQIKNFCAIQMLSQGVPMFVMGDEVRRTQHGNNNAYCHDDELSWFDWTLVEKNADIFRFFKQMITFRRAHPTVHRSRFFTGETNERGRPDVSWHGCQLGQPGWNDPDARALSFTLGGFDGEPDVHVILNAYWDDLDFALPAGRWVRVVDTAASSPEDIYPVDAAPAFEGATYRATGRSVVILVSR
jgi:isoamylase